MIAYKFTYRGRPVEVQAVNNIYLIKIDGKIVRVEKQVIVKKWSNLRLVHS